MTCSLKWAEAACVMLLLQLIVGTKLWVTRSISVISAHMTIMQFEFEVKCMSLEVIHACFSIINYTPSCSFSWSDFFQLSKHIYSPRLYHHLYYHRNVSLECLTCQRTWVVLLMTFNPWWSGTAEILVTYLKSINPPLTTFSLFCYFLPVDVHQIRVTQGKVNLYSLYSRLALLLTAWRQGGHSAGWGR